MKIVSSPKLPSERSFGFLFMAVFAIVGARGIFKHWNWIICNAFFLASGAFGLLALTNPKVLAPFNKAWFYLGRGIGKVVSPIVLGIIFLGVLTPVSILIWLFGRDELRLKRRSASSYWIDRTLPTVAANSFKNQF